MRRILLGAMFLSAGAVGLAMAQGAGGISAPPEAFIAARQAGMDLQFALVGGLKRAMDAKADVKPAKDAGDAILAWSRAIPGLFPAGSDRGRDTRALPVIWSDRAGFEKAAATLGNAAAQLSKAANAGDQAEFATAFQATAQACTGCHRTYRAR